MPLAESMLAGATWRQLHREALPVPPISLPDPLGLEPEFRRRITALMLPVRGGGLDELANSLRGGVRQRDLPVRVDTSDRADRIAQQVHVADVAEPPCRDHPRVAVAACPLHRGRTAPRLAARCHAGFRLPRRIAESTITGAADSDR